jgi:hypothetical protein
MNIEIIKNIQAVLKIIVDITSPSLSYPTHKNSIQGHTNIMAGM